MVRTLVATALAASVAACSGSYQGRQISLPDMPSEKAEANTPAAREHRRILTA